MKKFFCFLLIIFTAATLALPAACKKSGERKLSKYDIMAIYDGGTQVTGTVDFTFYNGFDNEITDLKFNLFGNAYREGAKFKPVSATSSGSAYYKGYSYGSMNIEGVENCAGWTVGGEDENILTVNLNEAVYPEQRVNVKIGFTLNLAEINHRTGVGKSVINLGNFYPILCAYSDEGFIECPYYPTGDPFVSDAADYNVTLDMPEEFTAAASGNLISESYTSDRKKCVYSLENARDFALALSKEFKVAERSAAGVQVKYYYTKDDSPEVSLNAACESLEYFSSTFGKYIYPTLSVVQTGFCHGGMEYPALTMISDSLSADDKIYTIVHENAHQWWYAMVGNNQLNCGWQDEGLAEYSSLCFFEANPQYSFTRAGLVGAATKAYRAFFSVQGQIFGECDTTMNRNLSAYSGDYEYANIAYNKGLLLFENLRVSVGDKKFFAALKRYFSANCGKIASPDDLISAFLKEGCDAEGFFSAYIDGKIVI